MSVMDGLSVASGLNSDTVKANSVHIIVPGNSPCGSKGFLHPSHNNLHNHTQSRSQAFYTRGSASIFYQITKANTQPVLCKAGAQWWRCVGRMGTGVCYGSTRLEANCQVQEDGLEEGSGMKRGRQQGLGPGWRRGWGEEGGESGRRK